MTNRMINPGLVGAVGAGIVLLVGAVIYGATHTDKAHEATRTSDHYTPGTKKVSEPRSKPCTVVKVIDGDTVKLNCEYPEGKRQVTVRLIGIDAPEMKDKKTGKPQCYAQQATQEAERLLPPGSAAAIWQDLTQAPTDRYGRVLAYVSFRADDPYYGFRGTDNDLGVWLVSNGYAKEYTYDKPYAKQSLYKAAQALADTESRGMWGACTW